MVEGEQDDSTVGGQDIVHMYTTVNLNLRAGGGPHEDVIGVIPHGKAVYVYHVEPAWSRVGYTDDRTNEWRTGWVATRYLERKA